MKSAFCYIAEIVRPEVVVDLVIDSLATRGVTINHPTLGQVTQINREGVGVETNLQEISRRLRDDAEVTTQFWFNSDTNVIVSFRQLSENNIRHIYSLDGLDARERELMRGWAVDYFRPKISTHLATLLVVDPEGVTSDVDWDVVVDREQVPGLRFPPAILGIKSPLADQLHSKRLTERVDVGDFALLFSDSSVN